MSRAAAAFAALLIVLPGLCIVRAQEIAPENLTPRQLQGKAWFEQSCNYCHGEAHHAARLLGKRLGKENALLAKRSNLDATYIRHVVRHGIVSMPWYRRSELPDADLDAIVDYLTRNNAR